MQSVSAVWYKLYYWSMLAFSAALLIACGLARFNPALKSLAESYELTTTTAVLALFHILFSFTAFFIIRRYNDAVATFACCMAFAPMLLNGLSQTNPGLPNLLYAIPWLAMVSFNGMFGLPIVLGSFFHTGVYVVLEHEFRLLEISAISWFLLIADGLLAFIFFKLWKRAYIDDESLKVRQLTNVLNSKEVQSATLIQSIADGVIVTNMNGEIGLMNAAASVLTDWPINEATGIQVDTVVTLKSDKGQDISATENPFTLVMKQNQHIENMYQLVSRNGQVRTVSMVISPVIVPGSTDPVGSVAVMRDVSIAHAEELKRAEFISTASHEMRTPVAAIEGYLALAMNDKVSKIDNKARDFLEKAHASTQHLGKLFQDLLTSAKAEDGRLVSHPVVVELGDFLEQVVESLKFSAEKKGLLLDFTVGATQAGETDGSGSKVIRPLYYVHADPDRLREVITNIFDNAVKYTPSGKVSVGLTGNDGVVQLFVKDTGPGIPTDDLPHLFQKFYRVDNTATRTIGGTGLGLFICKMIVELYQGKIWAESEIGRGSTFYINLPRLSSQKATELMQQEAQAPTSLSSLTTPKL